MSYVTIYTAKHPRGNFHGFHSFSLNHECFLMNYGLVATTKVLPRMAILYPNRESFAVYGSNMFYGTKQ